ncbi:hypothetical protein [Sphingomonas sp. UYP23]
MSTIAVASAHHRDEERSKATADVESGGRDDWLVEPIACGRLQTLGSLRNPRPGNDARKHRHAGPIRA